MNNNEILNPKLIDNTTFSIGFPDKNWNSIITEDYLRKPGPKATPCYQLFVIGCRLSAGMCIKFYLVSNYNEYGHRHDLPC